MKGQFYNYALTVLFIAKLNWLPAQNNQFIPLSVSNMWSYEGQYSSTLLIEKDTTIDFKKSYKAIEKEEGKRVVRVDYFVISHDSVFIYRLAEKKPFFAYSQNLNVGDTLTYRKEKGRVLSLNAKLKTPVSQYTDLVKIKWRSPDGTIEFEYFKPGIGLIAHETEDGILTSWLVKYKVK